MDIKLFTIPNMMTLGNLLCGCLGILCVFEGNLIWASYLIGIALVLDWGDGFVARLFNQSSIIGKELDSLADMVTFGVLPSFILYGFLKDNSAGYLAYIPFVLVLFSALRLAKFNIDTRQSESFIGVPTPANAMIVASLPLILLSNNNYESIIHNANYIIAYSLIMSYLLISELPLFALKFKNFSWANNKIKYIFLIISVLMLLALQIVAVPLIIIFYIALSIINNLWLKA